MEYVKQPTISKSNLFITKSTNLTMKKHLRLSILALILISCSDSENPRIPTTEKEPKLVALKKLITSPVTLESNTIIEYDGRFKVTKITETRGNGGRQIQQKMFYDNTGRINQILMTDTSNPDISIKLYWDSGKIIKSEWFEDSEFVHHNIYEYQDNQLIKFGLYGPNEVNSALFLFQEVELTYNQEGDLTKLERSVWMEEEKEMKKISTELFLDYTAIKNPYLDFGILPEERTQKHIPQKHIYQGLSTEFNYEYRIQLNEEGTINYLRKNSSIGQNEQVFFTYEF